MISNSTKQSVRILVDADSCPVMEEVSRAAEKMGVQVLLITSLAHFREKSLPVAETIYVDNIPQAADMEIAKRVSDSDIVVTGDYGLASLVLAKKAKCISPRGLIFSQNNIGRLLEERHIGMRLRRGGGRTKGPKPFTKLDSQRFFGNLCMLIQRN